ncbi:MAG: 3-phosphoshikimate 1-carboxyvinyltransferase [Clostridiales bacterium]
MNIEVHHSILNGEIEAIASKSQSHRILIAAALSDKPTTIKINSWSKDIEATLNAITELGAKSEWEDDDELIITPIADLPPKATLDCNESGSTLRFLFPVVGALDIFECTFIGRGKLPKRPMEPIITEMRNKGISIKNKTLPITIFGTLQGGEYKLPGNISSQFVSGLLFALPLLPTDSTIEITTPEESQSYIEMTIDVLKTFGITIKKENNIYIIKGNQKYISPNKITVEGDWSNAAFWFSGAALNGSITVMGLNPKSTQGDKKILDILKEMGAEVSINQNSITVTHKNLNAIEIDAGDIPDLVPVLAMVATLAQGTTNIINAKRLRLKECDRLFAMNQCITMLGGDIKETEDGLIIKGGTHLIGGKVKSFKDHRIAMSAAIGSVVAKNPIIIEDAEAVEKSYPHFFHDFQELGGKYNVLYLR